MKALAIVDIDDKLLEEYEDFAIEGMLIATSKEDTSWRDGVKFVGEIKLISFDKCTLKKVGKDYVLYERNYLLKKQEERKNNYEITRWKV